MPTASIQLRCPSCQSDLPWEQGTSITCTSCQLPYPSVGEIPWFYRDGERILSDWKAQIGFYLQDIERSAQMYAAAQSEKRNLKSTQTRLTHLQMAFIEQGKYVRRLLQPLVLAQIPQILKETGVKLPVSQGLFSYESNVFRDWCWGKEENEKTLELYLEVIPKGFQPSSMVALGSGAGRLPLDLHVALNAQTSLLIDINPFFQLAAREVLAGSELKLVEFPIAPRSSQTAAVTRSLKHDFQMPLGDVRLLFADAMNPPLASNSFDCLVAHWFLDIIPQDLRSILPRINRVLRPEGIFLCGGSCAFAAGGMERRYSQEEVEEALLESGFEIVKTESRDLPYLKCPDSSHSRVERVSCLAARKTREVVQPKDYRYLPEWITNSTLSIPTHPTIQGSLVQHKVYLDILVHVDGKRNMQQVAALFGRTYGLKPEEALAPVRSFLTREFESGIFGS